LSQTIAERAAILLDRLGVPAARFSGGSLPSYTPVTGAWCRPPGAASLCACWARSCAPPRRSRARWSRIEAGKIPSEGLGEVQEMIDICDFAVGLSRQLYGLTIATERPGHRMMETWHPLGVVGVISAFNFPVAVWSWNAALALVCGNPVVWKPSEKTPLTALASQAILDRALPRFGDAPDGLSQVLIGGRDVGEALVDEPKVALISATGSTRMGRDRRAESVAARFGRSILELGGNNAGIVCPSADLDMALRAIAFGAMGTAGQRCTTLRRLFVHESVYDALVPRLKKAYASVSVGNPLETAALVGPLVDKAGLRRDAEGACRRQGRGRQGARRRARRSGRTPRRLYVRPPWSRCRRRPGRCSRRTFAPILYVMKYKDLRRGARRCAQRRRCRAFLVDLHAGHARGRALPVGRRVGLRHRQRQYRHLGRRDRRRLRRREGNRRRPRKRLGRLEGLYAPRHQHGQLFPMRLCLCTSAAGAGRPLMFDID
jgi:aldehyde dehydrogenase (NAD+)